MLSRYVRTLNPTVLVLTGSATIAFQILNTSWVKLTLHTLLVIELNYRENYNRCLQYISDSHSEEQSLSYFLLANDAYFHCLKECVQANVRALTHNGLHFLLNRT